MTSLHDPDVADPPIGEYSTAELGALLRESRISLGRELEDVAAELRIRLVYLQAIEEGRLEELPGLAYATGFLRAYGDFLGLDGDDLVRRFKAAGMSITQSTDLQLPSPVEEGRLPTGSVLLVAALLAFGAYGGWYYMSSQGRDPIENVSAIPEQIAELVGIEGQRRSAAAPGDTMTADPSATDSNSSASAATTGDAVDGNAAVSPAFGAGSSSDVGTEVASVTRSAEPAAPAEEPATVSNTPAAIPAAEEADALPPPAAPVEAPPRTAEVDTDRAVASATIETPVDPPPSPNDAMVSTADAPPEADSAALGPPPIPPRRKPVVEARAPALPAESAETSESQGMPAARNDAPVASTIVAAAANGNEGTRSEAPATVSSLAGTTRPSATHRVVLRANTDTWVEIGAAEGSPVFSRLLRQGETFAVPPRPGLMMTTGNAGGIEILVDGKAVAMLGPVGEVRKNVALDAESLLRGRHATR